jgi:hypothetical protein
MEIKMNKSVKDFLYEIEVLGFSIFNNIVAPNILDDLRIDIERHEERCRAVYEKNGVADGMEGCAHHVFGTGDSMDDFLYMFYLDEYIQAYFDAEYILNTYGALNNRPYSKNSYAHGHRFHRDVRTFSGDFRLMLNMLVMVDDFTVENGATKVVAGSHQVKERPTDDFFEKNAVQALGNAGSIILFNSNLWHSAAPNKTNHPRKALTLNFSRAFIKPQFDYLRALGTDFPKNDKMRQLLGYNSRVPCNHDEWYQPPEKRMYKLGQG